MPAATSAPYLRATVTGQRRYADLVLPTDEPVSLLVPQLLELLDEPDDLGQVHLATSLGQVLDPAVPLGGTDLVDGARLRLVTARDLPPAPLVHDLVDVVERSDAPGRWTTQNRAATLSILGSLLVGAAVLAASRLLAGFDAVDALAAAVVLLGLSACAAALRRSALAWATGALGLGAGALAVQQAVQQTGVSSLTTTSFLVALAAVGLLTLAWCTRHLVAGVTGVVTLLGLAAVGALTWVLTHDVVRTAAVVSTLTVLLLGLLPRLALGASGVFGLDGRLAEGGEVATRNAEDAVARAHWTLTGVVGVAAAVFGAAAYLLGRDSGVDLWPAGLTAVVSAALALRARHFPLALHRGALWAAALCGALGLFVAAARRWPAATTWLIAALTVLGVLIALAGLVRLTPLQEARTRRWAQQVETAVILLSIPTVLGVFGVYQDLLGTFR